MREAHEVGTAAPAPVALDATPAEAEAGYGSLHGDDERSKAAIDLHAAHHEASSSSSSSSEAGATIETALRQQLAVQDDPQAQVASLQQALSQRDAELRQLQKTHDEYVKSSCEYEKELELMLELGEKRANALEQHARNAELAKELASAKLLEMQAQVDTTLTREQGLLTELEEMKWRVQRLEQANDELETAARIAQASIEDLEHKCETLLEQSVFLQQEKEELARQLGAITVAQVHPASAGAMDNGGSNSFRLSASMRSVVIDDASCSSEKAHASAAAGSQAQQQQVRGKNKLKGRYPDVVESCIHITCRKCRPSHHQHQQQHSSSHKHHHGRHSRRQRSSSAATSSFENPATSPASPEGAKKKAPSVFERLRLRVRALFDCTDGKRAPSTPGAAPAPVALTTT